jgi:hypothetical protein
MMLVTFSDGGMAEFSNCAFRVDPLGGLHVRRAPPGMKAGIEFPESQTEFVVLYAAGYWRSVAIINRDDE